jgi:hypothetical protein
MTTFVERRRQKRILVGLPIRVKGSTLAGGQFDEVTKSLDVSSEGASFLLKTPVRVGSMLVLSLPMPRQMQRSSAPNRPVYETSGLILRIEKTDMPSSCRIAVRFRLTHQKQYHAEV